IGVLRCTFRCVSVHSKKDSLFSHRRGPIRLMAMRAQTQSGDSQNIFDRQSHKNRISRDHENSHPEYVQVLPDFEEGAFEQSCAAGAVTLDLDVEVVALRPVIAAAFVSWRSVIANHQSLSWRPANGLLNSPKVIPTIFREQRIRAADALRRSRLRPFWRGRNSPSRRYPDRPSRRQPFCETIP